MYLATASVGLCWLKIRSRHSLANRLLNERLFICACIKFFSPSLKLADDEIRVCGCLGVTTIDDFSLRIMLFSNMIYSVWLSASWRTKFDICTYFLNCYEQFSNPFKCPRYNQLSEQNKT